MIANNDNFKSTEEYYCLTEGPGPEWGPLNLYLGNPNKFETDRFLIEYKNKIAIVTLNKEDLEMIRDWACLCLNKQSEG